MKKIIFSMSVVLALGVTSCTKQQLADNYADPSKVTTTTVEKQFSGFLASHNAGMRIQEPFDQVHILVVHILDIIL